MTQEELDKIPNPPEGWHTTDKITPCYGGMSGKECGKITEFMYPIFGKFVCEEHRGAIMGMPLCCTHCFQPYWPDFPERCMGEKWTGHCRNGSGCCHDRDRKLKEDEHREQGDGALKSIELSISAEGRPMIVVNTERNHYTIYYNPEFEMFRAYADKGGMYLNHFKLKREIWYHNASERINLVSFFNGTRDVTKEGIRYEDDSERKDFSLHEISTPPHVEGSGNSCKYGCFDEGKKVVNIPKKI